MPLADNAWDLPDPKRDEFDAVIRSDPDVMMKPRPYSLTAASLGGRAG